MAFPISPTNGQITVVNQVSYQYSTATNSWTRILSTANIITANTIAVNGDLTAGGTISAIGNITSGTFFIGNGSQLTGLSSAVSVSKIENGTSNVKIAAANSNVSVSVDGTANVLVFSNTGAYITGVVSATANIDGGNLGVGGLVTATGNITGGNLLSGGIASVTGNAISGNVSTGGLITATGNITGGNILTGGVVSATGNATAGNVLTDGVVSATGNATAGNVLTGGLISATANITGGNLTSLGTISGAGNVDIAANYYLGNGYYLTGVVTSVSNITNGNSNVIAYANGNIAASVGGVSNVVVWTTTGEYVSGLISASGNVTAGNILTAGLISATGNGTFGNLDISGSGGNITGANVITGNTISGSSNVIGGNLLTAGYVSATGNVTGNYFIGNGSLLTGIDTTTIQNGTSNVRVVSSGGNVAIGIGGTSNIAVFATSGGYITGEISASGNVTGSNLFISGLVSATGNATVGNLLTGGLVSATGNVTSAANISGGNILTGGLVSATGNIVTGANVSATANVSGGNILTGGLVSATANVTGGNLLTDGFVSSTGNVTGGNVLTGGAVSATGNVTGGNLLATTAVITGNIIGNNAVTITTTANANINLQPNGSGNIVLANTYINSVAYPAQDTDAATKLYVDNMVSTALTFHQAVYAATANTLAVATGGTITYAQPNGVANGIGATLTTTGTFTLIDTANVQTIGTRILVKNEANAVHNGIYTWANATNIVRSTDADQYGPDSVEQISINDYFFVQNGSVNGGSAYVVDAPAGTITFGTSNIEFAQFSQASIYTANTNAGLSLVGAQFNAKVDNETTAFDLGGNISVKASANLTTPNIGAATGTSLSTTGNIVGGNILTVGLVSATGNGTFGNVVTGGLVSATGNIAGGNILTAGLISATGTITSAANITGANLFTGGLISAAANITGGNIDTGGLVTATGNISGGNILTIGLVSATANVIGGNLITSGVASVTGNMTSGNISTAGLITATGNINGGNILTAGDISASGNAYAQNLSASGNVNIASLSVTGNIDAGNLRTTGLVTATGNIIGGNILTGGLISATGTITSAANITGANLLTGGLISATGNILTAGLVSATGNVTGNYILGNGAFLSGVITSVANINNGTSNVSIYAANANVAVSIDGTSNVAVFATTGEYITGILSASGNVIGGNVLTGGLISVTGNVTGGNLFTGGSVSATSNVYGNNFLTDNYLYANGTPVLFGVNYTASTTPPASPQSGWQWYNTVTDVLYEYLDDGTGDYWVDISSPAFAGGVVANISISGSMLVNANTAYDIGSSSQEFRNAYVTSYNGNVGVFRNSITVNSAGSATAIINGAGNGVGNIGSSSSYFNRVWAASTSAVHSDLAENYTADAAYEPGTVVDFGGNEEITLSTVDSSNRVAGVVSTAPAYLMNAGLDGKYVVTLALLGRVPVKVTGVVQKGDMMVSAGDGKARAVANEDPVIGTIIGKALENFNGGEGIIEIVIGKL